MWSSVFLYFTNIICRPSLQAIAEDGLWHVIGWTGFYGGRLYTTQSTGEPISPTILTTWSALPTQAAGYHPPAGGQATVAYTNVVPDSDVRVELLNSDFILAPYKACLCVVWKWYFYNKLFHRVKCGWAHLTCDKWYWLPAMSHTAVS